MSAPQIHIKSLIVNLREPSRASGISLLLGGLAAAAAKHAASDIADSSPATGPRFVLSDDGSYVTDTYAGIQWAGKESDESMDYEAAEKYAASLELGGLKGWSVPTLEQRETIIDRNRYNPAMPEPFKSNGGWEWTSTPYLASGTNDKGQPRAFWRVYGYYGDVAFDLRANLGFVRPCRLVSRPGQ